MAFLDVTFRDMQSCLFKRNDDSSSCSRRQSTPRFLEFFLVALTRGFPVRHFECGEDPGAQVVQHFNVKLHYLLTLD